MRLRKPSNGLSRALFPCSNRDVLTLSLTCCKDITTIEPNFTDKRPKYQEHVIPLGKTGYPIPVHATMKKSLPPPTPDLNSVIE